MLKIFKFKNGESRELFQVLCERRKLFKKEFTQRRNLSMDLWRNEHRLMVKKEAIHTFVWEGISSSLVSRLMMEKPRLVCRDSGRIDMLGVFLYSWMAFDSIKSLLKVGLTSICSCSELLPTLT